MTTERYLNSNVGKQYYSYNGTHEVDPNFTHKCPPEELANTQLEHISSCTPLQQVTTQAATGKAGENWVTGIQNRKLCNIL